MNSNNVQNFNSIQERFTHTENSIKKIDEKMGLRFDSMSGILAEIKAGLGLNLESLAAEFLKHLLKDRGIETPNVITNYILHAPTIPNTQREIDVYCPEPRIIIECTSFLGKRKKLQRFVETKNYLESDGIPCTEAYFICYGIHPELYEESMALMGKNNITLLSANSVLK